jgi:hypothetical protein
MVEEVATGEGRERTSACMAMVATASTMRWRHAWRMVPVFCGRFSEVARPWAGRARPRLVLPFLYLAIRSTHHILPRCQRGVSSSGLSDDLLSRGKAPRHGILSSTTTAALAIHRTVPAWPSTPSRHLMGSHAGRVRPAPAEQQGRSHQRHPTFLSAQGPSAAPSQSSHPGPVRVRCLARRCATGR